jgi:phage replication-related protein YjqB (UPF0714/DUF867 family)
MADRYRNFAALAESESKHAYAIHVEKRRSPVLVVAPHGGGIEPGTSEIALAISGDEFSYYSFDGKKQNGNSDLHITSTNFDEPKCLELLESADVVVAVHGEDGADAVAYLGGAHEHAVRLLGAQLEAAGFCIKRHSNPSLQGLRPRNICNLGRLKKGVQLELSRGLRQGFFKSLAQEDRSHPTAKLRDFAAVVRNTLKQVCSDGEEK